MVSAEISVHLKDSQTLITHKNTFGRQVVMLYMSAHRRATKET